MALLMGKDAHLASFIKEECEKFQKSSLDCGPSTTGTTCVLRDSYTAPNFV